MKLRVNRRFKRPEKLPGEGRDDYYNRIGTKSANVTAGIGRSGTKVHRLYIQYIETEDGIGLISCFPICGSAKFGSALIPYFNTDLSFIDCKKCHQMTTSKETS